jgi:hypothetical protein
MTECSICDELAGGAQSNLAALTSGLIVSAIYDRTPEYATIPSI